MFAEIFVPQDYTIRTAHGFKGPANTCATSKRVERYQRDLLKHVKIYFNKPFSYSCIHGYK